MLESQLFEQDQVQHDELYTTRVLERPIPPAVQPASPLDQPESPKTVRERAHNQTTEAFWRHWGEDGWVQDELLDSYKAFGINYVRVPVGYWMFEDDVGRNRTRDGYVYGSKAKLEELIYRVVRRSMKVIVVMSALPGGQTCCSTAAGRHTCATTNIYGPWSREAPDFFTGYASSSVDDPSRVTTCGVEYGTEQVPTTPKMWTAPAHCGDVPPNFYTDNPTHYASSHYSQTSSTGGTNPYYPGDSAAYPFNCPSMQFKDSEVWGGYQWTDPSTGLQYKDLPGAPSQKGVMSREWQLAPLAPLQQRGLDAFNKLLTFVKGLPSGVRGQVYVVPYENMAKGTAHGALYRDLQYAITTYHFHVLHAIVDAVGTSSSPPPPPIVQFLLNDEGVPIFDPSQTASYPLTDDFSTPKYQLSWATSYYKNVLQSKMNKYCTSCFQGYETSASFDYAMNQQMPVEAGVEASVYATDSQIRCLADPNQKLDGGSDTQNICSDWITTTSSASSSSPWPSSDSITTNTLGYLVATNVLLPLYSNPPPSPPTAQTASFYRQQWQFMQHTDMYRWSAPAYRGGPIGSNGETSPLTPMWVRVPFGTGRSSYDAPNPLDSATTQALLLTTVREFFATVGTTPTTRGTSSSTTDPRYALNIVFDTARAGVGYRFHTGIPGFFGSYLMHPTLTNGLDGNDPAPGLPSWHYPETGSVGWLMAHGRLYDHANTGTFAPFQYQVTTSS